MSKAFTREDDASEDAPLRPLPSLPPGVKNYITPQGAQALRDELTRLQEDRSRVAAAKDRAHASSIDARVSRVEQILGSVTIVPPTPADEVRFGASVTVKYPSGEIETFQIVGVNEIDLEHNR